MPLFKRIFGVSWQEMRAKVRYRLLVLTLLPILLTLISLIFITIYWNISYTGKQLFMKVRADLTVATNTLAVVQQRQEKQLEAVINSYEFQTEFRKNGIIDQDSYKKIKRYLASQRTDLNFDFLRLINVNDAAADPDLRPMLPKVNQLSAYSGLMVLPSSRLARLRPELAERAKLSVVTTNNEGKAENHLEDRGMLSRSLLPITNKDGKIVWYLDGGILLNKNTHIVDHIRDLVYDSGTLPDRSIGAVTIFMDNIRISTNVPLYFFSDPAKDRGRALGTTVSKSVQKEVLVHGKHWVDRAFVYNEWFISAYAPLVDIRGQRIGMIYSGFSESPFLHDYLLNILELATIIVLVLLISGLFVYRGAYSLLQPIEQIHHVVNAVQLGRNIRIGELGLQHGNELASLAKQFDEMLDLLQRRNNQIIAAAEQLEMKVEERTNSLQKKTKELQLNVKLLNETRQQLVTNEKFAALGELTAGIAHEINNPTAVILGNMELLKVELGDNAAQVEEEIDLVIQQVGRISSITRSLLQYSRPSEFNEPLVMQPITPIIEEMQVLVRHSLGKQEVVLLPEISATTEVQVSRPQLLQVLINLVVNAAHAMDGKGRIWIRSYDWVENNENLGVKLEIEDEGCGIPADKLSRIFDPFYTTRKDGTGLGLSLSYGIIKRIGGIFEVESVKGEGTTFTISIYHVAKEEASIPKPPSAARF